LSCQRLGASMGSRVVVLVWISLIMLCVNNLTAGETGPQIYRRKHIKHVIFENYMRSDNGEIGMAGFNFDTYMTDNLHYTLSILEAVGGQNRAGFAVAAMGLGTTHPISERLYLNALVLLGAGGGGHLAKGVGGGLSLKYQAGLQYFLANRFALSGNIGWLDFPDGNLSTPVYSVGLSWVSYDFVSKGPAKAPIAGAWRQRHLISIDTKTFRYSAVTGENITLLGGRSRTFLTPNWYWGEAGYAAVGGKRQGYIEGGLIAGYRQEWADMWFVDLGAFLGAAGGGGGAPEEGGGFNTQVTLDLGMSFLQDWTVGIQYGYTKFINGDIESALWGLNFGYQFWALQG